MLLVYATVSMISCSDDSGITVQTEPQPQALTFEITHPSAVSRATDTGFEDGDRIGIFVNKVGTVLEPSGNEINNEMLSCLSGAWSATKDLYLKEGNYNVCAYYPYAKVTSVDNMDFAVSTNQSQHVNYSASDLMYASSTNYSDVHSPIRLTFSHALSKLTIRLIKDEDYEGDLPSNIQVYIHNTVPKATFDMASGIATKKAKEAVKTIRAYQAGNQAYEAIIVPQRLETRLPLIEIVTGNISYLLESKFVFKRGMNHVVNIVIPNSPEQIKMDIGGTTQNWQTAD